MKYTQYFLYTRQRPERAYIKDEWIDFAIKNPIQTEIQSDRRIKKWAKRDTKVKPYCCAIAAIQISFSGIGLPFVFNTVLIIP